MDSCKARKTLNYRFMSNLDTLTTFLNKSGKPIIRRCHNCKHWWNQEFKTADNKNNLGYCKLSPLFFAFTLEPTVYPITKDFYLCASHELINEEHLAEVEKRVLLKDVLKKKDDVA